MEQPTRPPLTEATNEDLLPDRATRVRSFFALCLGGTTLLICICCLGTLGVGLFTADEVAIFPSEDNVRTQEETVTLDDDAESVRVEVSPQGEIRFGAIDEAPAETILVGSFRFNVPGYGPEISSTVNDGQQNIRINRISDSVFVIGEAVNEWRIDVSPTVPLTLEADTSSGDIVALFERGIAAEEVRFDSSSGNVRLEMAGENPNLGRIELDSSSGDIDITFSPESNVPALSNISTEANSGAITLDLRGTWGTDATITVDASSGDIELRLPANVGLDIDAETNSGEIRFNGDNQGEDFNQRTTVDGAPTLTVRIDVNSGDVTITTG
jgi:hypothetical protein